MSPSSLSRVERHASTMNNLIAIKRRETLREILEVLKTEQCKWRNRPMDTGETFYAVHGLDIAVAKVEEKLKEILNE